MIGYIIVYGYLFICFFILSLLRYYFDIKTEFTRKIMHFLTGLTWFIINHFYINEIHMIIIPLTFVLINILSYKFKIFKIVERTEKNHFGTVYYAIGILILQILNYFKPSFIMATSISVIILTFGDGAASFFGSLFKNNKLKLLFDKSITGFLSFILFSILGILIYTNYYNVFVDRNALVIIVLTGAVLELITGGGLDNLSILFGITTLAYLLL